MFLKEKRDSSVKVRMCADGRKQKDGTKAKQDTTLPTVATESVFIIALVRVVACFDIPGALYYHDSQGQTGRANGAGCTKSVQKIYHS